MMRKTIFLAGLCLALLLSASLDAREVISMNEAWNFTPTRSAGGGRWGGFARGGAGGGQQVVNLPHTWNAEDFMNDGGYRRGYGTYTKQFDVPDEYRGKRVFLQFEGAGSQATVMVNGKIVGEHKGAYNTFTFEVTDYLRIGTANSLTVICDNEPVFDIAPTAGDFNIYGGLYRDAWMIVTDEACISPLYFGSNGVLIYQPVVNEKRAEVRAEIHLSTSKDYSGCEVYFAIEDAAGKIVAERASTLINNDLAICALGVDNPHLWNGKEDPYLYKAVTVLKKDGKEIDRIEENIGFRYFWVDKDNGFFLNGRHIKLHGVCRHQDWAGIASALTEKQHLADYDLFDEIGANALRLAHYPQAHFMFREADRRGFLVWEEIPFVAGYVDYEGFRDNLRLQLKEMIIQNFNHPSIVFWGLFNEVHDNIDAIVADLNAIAHELDPGRLTTCATDQEHTYITTTDGTGWNKYFGWYYDTVADFGPFLDDWHARFPNALISISEYGGGAALSVHVAKYGPEQEVDVRSVSRGHWHPEEKQTYIHINNWKTIAERDYVWGSFLWNMFDFGSGMRQEGDVNNLNNKGLITHDRQAKKDAFFFYKANWNKAAQTVHLCSKRYTDREEDTTDVIVFTTAPSAKLYVNGKLVGNAKTDAYATVCWPDVKLAKGRNDVVVKTAHGEDSAVWTVK